MGLIDHQRLIMKYMSKYKDLPCYVSEFGMGKTRFSLELKDNKKSKEYERRMDMEEQERIKEEKDKINCYQCGSDRIEFKTIISDGQLTTVNLYKCTDCKKIFENPKN